MAAPIALREDFDGLALRVLARKTRDSNQGRRLLALAEIYDAGSRGQAALQHISSPISSAPSAPTRAKAQALSCRSATARPWLCIWPRYITGRGARRSLSAQFYAAVVKAHPDIPSEIGVGELSRLHAWLREHLYQHGHKFGPHEVVERTTGGPMSIKPFLAYLRAKYGELYQLPYVEAR